MSEKIYIIGSGNVGTHLFRALSDSTEATEPSNIVLLNSRNAENSPADGDIYFLTVKDDAIWSVVAKMPQVDGIVAHTSGSVPMDVLSRFEKHGVFYPMQTFSKDVSLDYTKIPFFIEGNSASVTEQLRAVASKISENIYEADSSLRKLLHIASVFSCNYVNHMWTIADALLASRGLSIEVMKPLIEETIHKLQHTSPYGGQTGPAVRGDRKIIERHLDMLKTTQYAEVYRIMADSIINTHKEDIKPIKL